MDEPLIRYRIGRRTGVLEASWSAPFEERALAQRMRSCLPKGHYRVGSENVLDKPEAIQRVLELSELSDAGSVLVLEQEDDAWLLRKVWTQPRFVYVPPPLTRVHSEVFGLWPHAECWGFTDTTEEIHSSKRAMTDIAAHLVTSAERLHCIHVIHRGRAWTPEVGWFPHEGPDSHIDRIHVEIGR